MSELNLYEQIGEAAIVTVITRFYELAFADPIIGHFFFGRDREHLTEQQIDFARSLLGGPTRYKGKPLLHAHRPLPIRPPHFARRQVLMAEVLAEVGITPELGQQWLQREETLRPLIVQAANKDHSK